MSQVRLKSNGIIADNLNVITDSLKTKFYGG